jgi:hypothetical protein
MATSTKQNVALVEVYDYELASGDPSAATAAGLAGKKVKVTLQYDKARSTAPIVWTDPQPVYTAVTDSNGFWHVFVVPTDNITPSGTYYLVQIEGYRTYRINPVLAGIPGVGWQSSAILLDTPASLVPAGQVVGNLQVNGTLGVTGAVTFSALTQGQVMFPGAAGVVSGDANLFWDNINKRLILGAAATQSSPVLSIRVPGNDVEFGHSNVAGYGSNIGANLGDGKPFLAFNSEIGTTINTFRTRGIFGSIIQSDLTGGLVFGTTGNANADNQALAPLATISTANPHFIVSVAGAVESIRVSDTVHLYTAGFGVDSAATSFGFGIWLQGVQVLHIANGGLSTNPTVDPPLNGIYSRGTIQLNGSVIQDNAGNAYWDAIGAAGTHNWRDNNAATTLMTLSAAGLLAVNQVNAFNGLQVSGDLGAGTAARLTLTNAVGIGNGANTNMQAPLKGTGGGPTTATLVTDWIKIYDGATTKWIPAFT